MRRHSSRRFRTAFWAFLSLGVASAFGAPALSAQSPPRKIGELELTLGGLSATVSPAEPVIPKNIQSGVEIVVRSGGARLTADQVAQALGGPFAVAGVLSGPGLPQAIDVPLPETPAADPLLLLLPALTEGGDYILSNLRLVAGGRAVLDVSPGAVPVKVIDQVLVTSVQTRALTLAEIQAKGIVLDSSDVLGFDFTIGLQLSSQVVNITFPVVFDRQGVPIPQPIAPPPAPPRLEVPIPELPTIVPLLLKPEGGGELPQVRLPNGAMADVRIPSVLVIPGNVGFLKQFFSAQLYVANGAPGGSNLSVRDVTGTILLPPGADHVLGTADDPLALPNTVNGPQPATLPVLGLGPDGTPSVATLNPGETGQAEFLIRGEKEGFHPLAFDIHATLEGLVTGPVGVTGSASGGVLVRNPFFDMTFTVPGIVRKGERFKVFATVTNISQALANDLTLNLDAASTSGARIEGSPSQSTPTLAPGDAKTFAFEFTSLRTGKVVASYLKLDTQDGSTGSLHFSLGVDDRGVPLSPDTLSLPSAVAALPGDVLEAAMRVLGQAWSVANAPAGTLPNGVIRTSKTVVTQKALALAEAGLRRELGQPAADALRDLVTDFWGGSPLDAGFDQLLRQSDAGHDFAAALGAALAEPMQASGGAVAYQGDVSRVAVSGPDFLAVAVGDGSGAAPVEVALTDGSGNLLTSRTPGGAVPGGVLLPLGFGGATPWLGLVTAPTAPPYTLLLTGHGTGAADLAVTLPRGDGSFLRATIAGVSVTPTARLKLALDPAQAGVLAIDADGDGAFETSRTLAQEVLRAEGPQLLSANVIGPETLSQAGPFGLNAVLLFDRVVTAATARLPGNYAIPGNAVRSAGPQMSGRLVFANLAQPEGPYVPTTIAVQGIADPRGVVGPARTVPLASRLEDPGAVVSGRVFNADGSPVGAAQVTYSGLSYDPNCADPFRDRVGLAATPLGADGRYQFRYVRQDNCGAPFTISTTDPSTGALRQVTSYVRSAGQQLVLDIALFGRGSVAGTVRDLGGHPVPGATVVAVSGTDPQVGGQATTDGDGRYLINGITVGPVNVSASKGGSLGHSAGRIDLAGTTATVDVTLDGGSVEVHGTVQKVEDGVASPLPGATVIYYLRDAIGNRTAAGLTQSAADGSYTMTGLPTGPFAVVAQINSRDRTESLGVAAAGDDLTVPLVITIATNVGTVNGTVTLPGGAAAGGVLVSLADNGVLTNADGTYQLTGVPVLPSVGQTIRAQTLDGLRRGQTTVIVNTPNQVIDGADITLSGLGTAQFTVLDATGQPVAGQEVRLSAGFCNDSCGCAVAATDGQGQARFPGLPLGTVTGRAIKIGGAFIDLAIGSATLTTDGATGFGVLRFPGSGTVKGTVVDADGAAVHGADVALSSNVFDPDSCTLSQRLSQRVQTDTNGQFQFSKVNVGRVNVTASQAFFPAPVGAQGTLAQHGDVLTFNLKLVNTIAGVLSGTVYRPDGVTPAANVEVTADGPLPDVTVATDAAGFYKFAKILPEGLYTLTASDPVSGAVFRTQVFLRAGQDATVDLRLKGTGTVRVHVVDGAGQPVASAFVKLQETEYPNETFDGALGPSDLGTLVFEEVFAGSFSVQVTDTFGRGGRASGVLPAGTAEVEVTVQLTTTGTVRGHFYRADGTTPIALGVVQLVVNGRTLGQTTTASSGDPGAYSFDFVPAGPVRLEAQDPLTARTGVAAGQIDEQDQVLVLDVVAQGIGTVQGLVTSDGAPQPGARVQVVSGTFSASTFADSTGSYGIQGVPEGRVVVTADLGNGFLSGTNAATLAGDGTTLTLDVALRGSGSVTGLVVQADGATPAPLSAVSIQVGGTGGGTLDTTSDAAGSFFFPRVPAGVGTLSARVLGDIDVGKATVTVPAGEAVEATVRLNGTGGLSGLALDSAGQPVAGTLQLTGTGAFPYSFTLTAAADGRFALPKVLAGPFTAKLRVTAGGFTLFGSASGAIAPGETFELTVQLQDSGTVTGLVLRPDGVTPAVGANVAVQLAVGGAITVQVQNDGRFTATGVPLGAFTVRINDPLTAGLGLVQGRSITANGEVVDVGTVTLDDDALTVLAVDPPDGAVDVGVHQAVTVTFSDVLQGTAGVFLTRSTGGIVAASARLGEDGKSVLLEGTWPDGATLLVNVTAQVTDLFGRPLPQPQVTRFTTVDLTPPSVVAVAPANQAIQVSPDAVVVVTFSEPLSPTAPLAGVVALAPAGGVPVEGSEALTAPNVVTFTPAAPLAGNTRYTVLVNGAADLAGNVQTVAFASTFATTDTVAPTLVLNSPADGAIVKTAQPAISITLADALSGVDPATAVLMLDGQSVSASAGTSALVFTPSAPLAEGSHAIAASVEDRAGNEGTLAASFVVDTRPPSVAVLAGITAGQVLRGEIAVTATASDDGSGVARIELLVDGVKRATLLPPDFAATLDTTQLADGSHLFTVQAVDAAGNAGPASEPVQAFVENRALTVTITSPAANTPVKGQVVVTAVASEPVERIEFSLGEQTVTATSAPYQGTLSLAGVADGPQTITATAFNFVGDSAAATRTILVQQTPPPAPNPELIFAEPPINGASLVHGLPGAVRGGLTVTVSHTVSGAQATATAAADGSFATNIAATVDDLLSLVASDSVGNVSAPTLVTVRRTPSLPPATGSTSLHYEGNLADRVGLTAGSLTPDGAMDAVFTLSLTIGQGITRQLTFIDLQSSSGALRSTRSGQVPLGVAADAGAPLQNNDTGQVSFAITSGATLTLFAGDDGFIAPGSTYMATAAFADGSRFVGSFTLVPPADRTQVAHSATITASPATVAVAGGAPGTTTLTVRDIRDIDGSLVPDGAKIALSAANMAARNPAGAAIASAGGTIVDGEPAANNAAFKVFTLTGGEVTATYSSDPVTPAPVLGALAVVQMQAADADGNVLGTEAVATLDINLRVAADRALVHPVPAVLYGDGADRRSHFVVEVRDVAGNPVPDGTPVLVSAANCAALTPQNTCIGSIGGQILGGQSAAAGSNYRLFTVAGGRVEGDYSTGTLTAGNLKTRTATLQVLAATPTGGVASSSALGTATVTLAGAGSVELTTVPGSVPYVFPVVPVQVFGHHAHDIRSNLIPDGANLILSAANCATLTQTNNCIGSIGGTLLDGAPSPSGSNYRVFPLSLGEIAATYSIAGASAPATGQTRIANLQAVMGDVTGRLIDSTGIGLFPLQVLGPSNAIGTADPATVLADGASHTSTVTFTPLLDAVGNPIPDGTSVVVSAANCAGLTSSNSCISSVGGQILNGTDSPSGSHLKVLTVEDGRVTATYADQGITATPGQLRTANVVVLPANASGAILSSIAMGAVPVSLAGPTSGTGTASPSFVFADGSDQRTTVTLTGFKDAAGQPLPDGTRIAVSAGNCFSVTPQNSCHISAGGVIVGTDPAPFNSTARLFTLTNGQVVLEYSAQGVSVATGQRTAMVQAVPVTPQGNLISSVALVAVPVTLLAQGSAAVEITPADLFADGRDFRSQVVVSNLLQADGVTPVPDGTKVGLTAGNCAAVSTTNSCILSAGGAIFAAGTTPGDGTVAPSNSNYKIFTVAGGQVQAVYSDASVVSQFNQTRTASVAVVPASSTGTILTTVALGFGAVQLRGMASATASGPETLSLSGPTTTGTVTFSAIKDTAGNTVPDGSVVVVAVGNCTTTNTSGSCNLSTGGTIVDGAPSPSGSQFKAFTVTNGTVNVTYSTAGATVGTARVQLLPGIPDGSRLGSTTLAGGVWAINVTN